MVTEDADANNGVFVTIADEDTAAFADVKAAWISARVVGEKKNFPPVSDPSDCSTLVGAPAPKPKAMIGTSAAW